MQVLDLLKHPQLSLNFNSSLHASNELNISCKTHAILQIIRYTGIIEKVSMLCDEATSALDSTTETEILTALRSLANNRTAKRTRHVIWVHLGFLSSHGEHSTIRRPSCFWAIPLKVSHVSTAITCLTGTSISFLGRSHSRALTKPGRVTILLVVGAVHFFTCPNMVVIASVAFWESPIIGLRWNCIGWCRGGEGGLPLVVIFLGSLCLLYHGSLANAFVRETNGKGLSTFKSGRIGSCDMTLDMRGQTPNVPLHFLILRSHHPWTEYSQLRKSSGISLNVGILHGKYSFRSIAFSSSQVRALAAGKGTIFESTYSVLYFAILGARANGEDRFSLLEPARELNHATNSGERLRLAAHKVFVGTSPEVSPAISISTTTSATTATSASSTLSLVLSSSGLIGC
ncbi:hypothetical protein LXL04_002274 [Taraxacum kok-saghyz]